MADHRLGEAIDDLCGFLRAGINVVSSGPVFLQYPDGVMPDEMIAARSARPPPRAAPACGSTASTPGFANDWLPLTLTSISERIEEVRCMEILNYATYDQAMVLNDIMGFGRPLDETPFILLPGVLTTAWGSVVRQLAAGLGVELDEIEEHYERVPAPETFEIPTGTIAEGTAAALRFEVRGKVGDRAPIVLEHVTRLRDDLAPDWPQPTGHGCYRVVVTGEPNVHARPAAHGHRRRPQHRRAQGDGHAPRQRGAGGRGRPARPAHRARPAAHHRPRPGALSRRRGAGSVQIW